MNITNNSLIFKSELTNGKEIRVFGDAEKPYFVAKDVAQILGYTNSAKAVRDHVDDYDKITYLEYKQKNQILEDVDIQPHTILINQRGLQTLIQYGKNTVEIY